MYVCMNVDLFYMTSAPNLGIGTVPIICIEYRRSHLHLQDFIYIMCVCVSVCQLSFDTREEAIAFAELNGWKYELIGDTSKQLVDQPPGTNKYQHNFLSRKVT